MNRSMGEQRALFLESKLRQSERGRRKKFRRQKEKESEGGNQRHCVGAVGVGPSRDRGETGGKEKGGANVNRDCRGGKTQGINYLEVELGAIVHERKTTYLTHRAGEEGSRVK